MHLQIRTPPALSPANLAAFLTVLAENDINIQSAGGCDIEYGGDFVFSVAHEDHDRALRVLQDAGYSPKVVEVDLCALSDEPGQLLACITEVSERNALMGRAIRDITVGVADADGRIQVQIFSN
jgi:hypothetical protein